MHVQLHQIEVKKNHLQQIVLYHIVHLKCFVFLMWLSVSCSSPVAQCS